jgi:DNA repair exonuclease SbcCD ATPase subunit
VEVQRLELNGILCHKDTTIELPQQGIVLVTGPNGSGKSSIIEAVSLGVWGKTLRGASGWNLNVKNASVRVTTWDEVQVLRESKKKSLSGQLNWRDGKGSVAYETTTKAQEALESVVGSWDVWRRCCVFSSHDAAHFSRATDGERKRLLESILGLERFDIALSACREHQKTFKRQQDTQQREIDNGRIQLEGEERRLRDAQIALEALPPLESTLPGRPAIEYLEKKWTALRQHIVQLSHDRQKYDTDARVAQTKIDKSKEFQTLLLQSTCPTCRQSISSDVKRTRMNEEAKLIAELQVAIDHALDASAEVEAVVQSLVEDDKLLELQVMNARREIQAAELKRQHVQSMLAARERAVSTISSVERIIAQLSENKTSREASLAEVVVEVEILDACESVLGLKGVRANVLGACLGGIEAMANLWLSRLSDGVRVELQPYEERKSGSISQSIGLKIVGYGGDYQASSGGERRRLDVALLLALAEVSSAAFGLKGATLFFDEVFDTLDIEGVERASVALSELAKNRCVVVIAHSDAVKRSLAPDVWLKVAGGNVSC